jgi:hypothetical protein
VLIGLDLLYEELVDESFNLEEVSSETSLEPLRDQSTSDRQGDPMEPS